MPKSPESTPAPTPDEDDERTPAQDLANSGREFLDSGKEFLKRGKDFFRSLGSSAVYLATEKYTEASIAASDAWDKHVREPRQQRAEEERKRALHARIDRVYAPERKLNKLVTDDKEILGKSRHLGRDMREKTRDVSNKVHENYVSARNVLRKPRDQYLEFRRDRIALKVQRLERRVATGPNTLWNKHLKNELEMFKKRQQWRERQLSGRQTKHIDRIANFVKSTKAREEKYQGYIDHYTHKQIEKRRQKEIVKLMERRGLDPKDSRERFKFTKKLLANKVENAKLTRKAILDIREENIRRGKLDVSHSVDRTKTKRSIHEYSRAVN